MIPKYVFHYTTADTLLAILESGKIRFTRLDLVNDPYEGLCKLSGLESNEFAANLFCSCWSDSAEENIALWKIYTECNGIRIMADSNLFGPMMSLRSFSIGYAPVTAIKPITVHRSIDKHELQISSVCGPIKVAYVPGVEPLSTLGVRTFLADKGKETQHLRHEISLFEIGSRKEIHWAYENEWRYLLSPFMMISTPDNHKAPRPRSFVIEDHVDIPFDRKKIVEVMAGPEMDTETYTKLDEVLMRYGIQLRKSLVKTRFPKKAVAR